MTDTVGFIQRLPTELVAAFRATLEEVQRGGRSMLHVIDATHPDAVRQAETVERVLDELGLSDRPMVVAANKVDRLTGATANSLDAKEDGDGTAPAALRRAASSPAVERLRDLYPDLVPISARTGWGLEALAEAIDGELAARLVPVVALIPYAAGDVLSLVHGHGVVEQEEFGERGTRVVAKVPPYLIGSLRPYLEGG